jgi:hypothetical protein
MSEADLDEFTLNKNESSLPCPCYGIPVVSPRNPSDDFTASKSIQSLLQIASYPHQGIVPCRHHYRINNVHHIPHFPAR